MKIIGDTIRFRSAGEARAMCGALFLSRAIGPWRTTRDGRGRRAFAWDGGRFVPLSARALAR